jgi:hypothetical protein
MSQTLHISEAAYRVLSELAREQGQTPEALVESWVAQHSESAAGGRDPYTDPRYYTLDGWLRHLDVSEEVIERTTREAELDADS